MSNNFGYEDDDDSDHETDGDDSVENDYNEIDLNYQVTSKPEAIGRRKYSIS